MGYHKVLPCEYYFCFIYINDLPNFLTWSTTTMFDDNTILSTRGKSIIEVEDKLNTDLENVHQWLMANKLLLNKDKTE